MSFEGDSQPEDAKSNQRGPLRALLDVRPDERTTVVWSVLYSFCVLASYYLLRPLREEIGADQPANIDHLWTGTFFAMLIAAPIYAAVASRLTRSMLISVVYRFFIANMLILYIAITLGPVEWRNWIDRLFYIWLSVFNLFIIASFWSFMADIYHSAQAKRLFGLIAAGGTLGAIAGSAAAVQLPKVIPPFSMMLAAVALLEAAVWMAIALNRHDSKRSMRMYRLRMMTL